MARREEIELLLTAKEQATSELKKIEAALKSLGAEVQKTSKETENYAKKNESLGSTLKGLAAIGAAYFSVSKIVDFTKESVQAAQDSIFAQERLITLLGNSTGATQEQVDVLFKQAEALQAVGVVSKDNIIAAQGTLATFDLQVNTIKELIPSLLNYAVAEKGVALTTQDMTTIANGFGKALQGQTRILTDVGFVLTEHQKLVLQTGSETERLATITEILGSTYEGVNEIMGDSFIGRMQQAQFAVADLKEGIGMALIPTIETLLSAVSKNAAGFKVGDAQLNEFSKTVYKATNFLLGIATGTYGVIKSIIGFGEIIIEADKVVFTAVKDMAGIFKNFFENVSGGVSAVSKALSGDFEGAVTEFKKMFQFDFSATKSQFQSFSNYTGAIADDVTDTWENVSKFFNEAMTMKNFKPVDFSQGAGKPPSLPPDRGLDSDSASKIKKEIENLSKTFADFGKDSALVLQKLRDDNNKSVTKITEDLQKLNVNYEQVSADGIKAVKKLEEQQADSFASIDKSIQDVSKRMQDLNSSFSSAKAGDVRNLAEAFVQAEEKIATLQESLRSETDSGRIQELRQQIAQQESALSSSADVQAGIANEITEARRRAGLSDIQRAIEDFQTKRDLAQTEFNARMSELQAEAGALQDKREQERIQFEARIEEQKAETAQKLADLAKEIKVKTEQAEAEKALFLAKEQLITKAIEDANILRAQSTQAASAVTKDAIQQEIEKYKELISLIKEAASASAGGLGIIRRAVPFADGGIVTRPTFAQIGEAGPEAVIPLDQFGGLGNNYTVNINGASFMDQGAAEQIGDLIIDKLKDTMRIGD